MSEEKNGQGGSSTPQTFGMGWKSTDPRDESMDSDYYRILIGVTLDQDQLPEVPEGYQKIVTPPLYVPGMRTKCSSPTCPGDHLLVQVRGVGSYRNYTYPLPNADVLMAASSMYQEVPVWPDNWCWIRVPFCPAEDEYLEIDKALREKARAQVSAAQEQADQLTSGFLSRLFEGRPKN